MMLGHLMKLLVVLFLQMKLSENQSTCLPFVDLPFPLMQTGSLAPVINGSYTGVLKNYTFTYQNTYSLKLPMIILGVRTFKSPTPTSLIDWRIGSNNVSSTMGAAFVQVGPGFILQYIQFNYIVSLRVADNYNIYIGLRIADSTINSLETIETYEGDIVRYASISAFPQTSQYVSTTLPEETNKIITFMVFVNITSTLGNLNKMTQKAGRFNDSHISVTLFKPSGVVIRAYFVTAIYYTTAVDINGGRDMSWGGVFNYSASGGTYTTGKTWATSFMFTGLSFFEVFNQTSVLDYQSSYSMSTTSRVTIQPQKPYNSSKLGLKSTTTGFFHTFRFYCTDTSYSYNYLDGICYASCPTGTSSMITFFPRCRGCSYNCLSCTNSSWDPLMGASSSCTSCNASQFRVLVNKSCVCVNASYFDDGYSATCRTCSSVVTGTLTCSFSLDSSKPTWYYSGLFSSNWATNVIPLYTSLSCSAGYILFNNLCKTCTSVIPYCISCVNSSQCATCNSSVLATKSTDGKCYLCNISNCQTCMQNNVCSLCASGYVLNGTSCVVQPCNTSCICGGYTFPIVNGFCMTICGDGIKAGIEQCDDGNLINHDGCSSQCQVETCDQNCSCSGWYFPLLHDTCSTVCGDGFRVGIQECDDGNVLNHDGCSSSCKIQTCARNCSCDGYTLPLVNDSCSTICGDQIIAGLEQCDDGNTIDFDGCSSTCQNQPCNLSCTCAGWYLPKVENVCSSVCGDGIKTSNEQCDDNNTQSHDGCNSFCKIQISCNQTCSCDGWIPPFANGSCSTFCGDGLVRGHEECDDGNTQSGDGCSDVCNFQEVSMKTDNTKTKTASVNQFWFFSQEKTFYGSLILFCMGFRIVGMEMLWIFQSFQLLLDSQPFSSMKLSNNIHGYSDPKDFPFNIPNLETQLFDKFNYMFFFILSVFIICTFLETLGQCCKSGNNIANNLGEDSALPFNNGSIDLRQKQAKLQSEKEPNDNEEFTVHYEKRSNYKIDLMSETKALSVELSQLESTPQTPTFFSKLSRKILRQFFFDLIINVQPVIFATLTKQIIKNGLQSIMNFPTTITFGIVELFFGGVMLFCWRGGDFFGENQAKFKENKFMRYWMVTSCEKIAISVLIGGTFSYWLYIVSGIRLFVMVYFWIDKVYYSSVQNYRARIMQFMHSLLFALFVVNKVYLTPSEVVEKLPPYLIEITYTVILGIVLVITLGFYFQELTNSCQANGRNVSNNANEGMTEKIDEKIPDERIFYSRRQVGESGIKIQSKVSPTSLSIIQEMKSKKILKNCHDTTYNSQRSKLAIKSKQRPQQQLDDDQGLQKNSQYDARSRRQIKSYRKEKSHKQIQEYTKDVNFRDTEDEFEMSRYAKSSKAMGLMKTRRAGKQININTQNQSNRSHFIEQNEFQHYKKSQGLRSVYRSQHQNDSNPIKIKRAVTQKNVKSIKDIKHADSNQYDFQTDYCPVSTKFK